MAEGQAEEAAPLSIEERVAQKISHAEPEPSAPAVEGADAEDDPKPETKEPEKPTTIEIDPDEPLFDVEIVKEGGEKEIVKHSLKQLTSERMMQADYQRKTAELARAREALAEEIKSKTEPVIKNYETELRQFQQALVTLAAPELEHVDWGKLAIEDPAEHVRLSHRANQVRQAYQAAQGRIAALENERTTKAEQDRAEKVRQAVEHLTNPATGIPKFEEEYPKILKTGVEVYGYKQDEVGNETDPRFIKVLHDAMQFQALKAAKPNVEKRIAIAPKVMKPGAQAESDDGSTKDAELRKQARKSGKVDDFAALIAHRMTQKR